MGTRRPGGEGPSLVRTATRALHAVGTLVDDGPVRTTAPGVDEPCAAGRGMDEPCTAGPGVDEPCTAGLALAPTPTATPLVRALEETVRALQADGPTPAHRSALTGLLDAWAAGLVELHGGVVDAAAPSVPRPWVLRHEELPRWLRDLPAEAGPAWAVREHPRVRRALREARAGWVTTQPVQLGDVEDVLLDDAPPVRPVLGLRRTDPEPAEPRREESAPPPARALLACGGRGDARWDVASALDWIAVTLVPALDAAWRLDPVTAFMTAYRARGGRAEPTRAIAVARTVTTAIEWSLDLQPDARDGDDDLRWLAALWGRPLALVDGSRGHRQR